MKVLLTIIGCSLLVFGCSAPGQKFMDKGQIFFVPHLYLDVQLINVDSIVRANSDQYAVVLQHKVLYQDNGYSREKMWANQKFVDCIRTYQYVVIDPEYRSNWFFNEKFSPTITLNRLNIRQVNPDGTEYRYDQYDLAHTEFEKVNRYELALKNVKRGTIVSVDVVTSAYDHTWHQWAESIGQQRYAPCVSSILEVRAWSDGVLTIRRPSAFKEYARVTESEDEYSEVRSVRVVAGNLPPITDEVLQPEYSRKILHTPFYILYASGHVAGNAFDADSSGFWGRVATTYVSDYVSKSSSSEYIEVLRQFGSKHAPKSGTKRDTVVAWLNAIKQHFVVKSVSGTPTSLETYKRRVGTWMAVTKIAQDLLNLHGIKTQICMVHDDRTAPFDVHYAQKWQFQFPALRSTINNEVEFFEISSRFDPVDAMADYMYQSPAIVCSSWNEPEVVDTFDVVRSKDVRRAVQDVRVTINLEKGKSKHVLKFSGASAAAQRGQMEYLNGKQRLAYIRSEFEPKNSISIDEGSVTVENFQNLDEPLIISFDVDFGSIAAESASGSVLNLDEFVPPNWHSLQTGEYPKRQNPIHAHQGWSLTESIEVVSTDGHRIVGAAVDQKGSSNMGRRSLHTESTGSKFVAKREVSIERGYWPADKWIEFEKLMGYNGEFELPALLYR